MQSIKTWAGVDVSAKTLAAKRRRRNEANDEAREFSNDAAGHRELLKWIGRGARVCMEATGVYHLQLALMLVAAGVDVMVINPRVAKDFGRAWRTEARRIVSMPGPCSSMSTEWTS